MVMTCSSCGAEIIADSPHCGSCGKLLRNDTTEFGAACPADVQVAPMNTDDVKLFVGSNHEYYLKKWHSAEQSKARFSFNWAALFAGLLWLAYRKMYIPAGLIFAMVIILEVFFPNTGPTGTILGFSLGMSGNGMYKAHVQSKMKKIYADNSPQHVPTVLAIQGGTNFWAPLVFLFGGVFLFTILES